MAANERGKLASHDPTRNIVWLVLLAVVVAMVVVPVTRARAARASAAAEAAAEDEEGPSLPPGQLVPVPMSVELTGPISRAPLSFVSAMADDGPRTHLSPGEESAIASRARLELDRVAVYDNTWMEVSGYPMGDVPTTRGACTDVVVRSLRAIGIDLQQLVHEDLVRDMPGYAVTFFDKNIDHRRVSTMFTFFTRNAMSVTTSLRNKAEWRAGDIVFVAWQWMRGAPAEHVGILSDKIGPRGLPLVIENGGPRPIESDSLGRGKVVGHFRALQKR